MCFNNNTNKSLFFIDNVFINYSETTSADVISDRDYSNRANWVNDDVWSGSKH